MGSKTKNTTNQTQTQNSTMTYGTGPAPDSADIRNLRGMVANPNEIDPRIAFNSAATRRDFNNSFMNPLGAYTTPAVRDAANRNFGRMLNMQEGVAAQGSVRDAQERAFQQQSYLAGLTAPPVVQTSGSSTGTVQGTSVSSYNPGVGSYISQGLGAGIGLL